MTEPTDDQDLIDQILAIVAQECNVDRAKLTPEARIDEIGIASIDMAQTIFALESHFDIEIPMAPQSAGQEFATVADLTAHTLAAIRKANPTG